MKLLGIDFGSKRVGIAISSDDNRLAFPKKVLANDKTLIPQIQEFCRINKVTGIVLGESTDYSGGHNPIMKKAQAFKTTLQKVLKLPVYWEPEFLTSQEAMRIQGEKESIDASAAAIILQSYLDKNK